MFFYCIICVLINVGATSLLPPKLAPLISQRSQIVGSKFKIFCQIEEGQKPFQFRWYFGSRPLSESTNLHIENSEEDSLLVIDQLSVSHTGNYSCTVRNNFGETSQLVALSVTCKLFPVCHNQDDRFAFVSTCGAYGSIILLSFVSAFSKNLCKCVCIVHFY